MFFFFYVTSLFTWAWKPVHEAVKYYKRLYPKAEIWLGGPYATLLPKHAEQSGAKIYCGLFEEAEDFLKRNRDDLILVDVQRLNRLLIEAAYPYEIGKSLPIEE